MYILHVYMYPLFKGPLGYSLLPVLHGSAATAWLISY